MCGFIKRFCTTFTDVRALQSLYISLVKSQLEYYSVIWNPWQQTVIDKIERVKTNPLSIYVTNPKCSTPLTIILRFVIILDCRPFNIVGKLQICVHSHLFALSSRKYPISLPFEISTKLHSF